MAAAGGAMAGKEIEKNVEKYVGPVCPVVWEGGAARLLPIPID